MNVSAIDLAIYNRLVGAPLDNMGRPQLGDDGRPVNRLLIGPPDSPEERQRLPSWGIRVPMISNARDTRGHGTTSSRGVHPFQDFTENSFNQVKVVPINFEGVNYYETWPCVAFYHSGMESNYSTYLFHDPIAEPIGNTDIKNRNGDTVSTGPEEYSYRRHPEADDILYVIRAHAKDHMQMKWIMERIRYYFPQRGVLEVEAMDGNVYPLDMIRTGFEVGDRGGRDVANTIGGRAQREFEHIFTYRIEGYVDNTKSLFDYNDIHREKTITERVLELANAQNKLLESQDVNDLAVPSV